jgi:hypothetical protein
MLGYALIPACSLAIAVLAGLAKPASAIDADEPAVYLLHPDQRTAPSDADCEAAVSRTGASTEKAMAFLWGRNTYGTELEFYLVISDGRMDTTFAAEGDYDSGTVTFGRAESGRTPFLLVPDDHPDLELQGEIVARTGSPVSTVILRDLPSASGTADRTSYYCRVDDGTVT